MYLLFKLALDLVVLAMLHLPSLDRKNFVCVLLFNLDMVLNGLYADLMMVLMKLPVDSHSLLVAFYRTNGLFSYCGVENLADLSVVLLVAVPDFVTIRSVHLTHEDRKRNSGLRGVFKGLNLEILTGNSLLLA